MEEATVAAVVVVAMLISLVLAELYCTLLLRKSRHPDPPSAATHADHPVSDSVHSLRSFYAQGVIRTPRNFLLSDMQLWLDHQETASPESWTTGGDGDQLMYICNPMYDKMVVVTPFETPPTSPPRLDVETQLSCSGSGGSSPPLTPMEKLPAEGGLVSLGDGPSNSNTVDGGGVTSSSSASTSPSW